ncbi:MAG: ABC transporter permease [Kiritimatiellia bacterium]|jgi:tungstate transport system permease protein|nr:ABC transporter permease [Kiritimatiellia bacterium]MDP6849289.1 ABC transporter permease [Kiritimatiellia bacterium]
MDMLSEGLSGALRLLLGFDPDFTAIVAVSVLVAFTSTSLAALTAVPVGVLIAQRRFPGRGGVIAVLNTLMSLPTVVVGLLVYSMLSRNGLFGSLGLLYTRTAMVIGQWILAFPIVAALTVATMEGLDTRVHSTAISLGASPMQAFLRLLSEARFGIVAAVVAGFGRVFAEVGVSMMLGGNIKTYTRSITTAIALETNRGEFALGLALGIVLLTVALLVNILLALLKRRTP